MAALTTCFSFCVMALREMAPMSSSLPAPSVQLLLKCSLSLHGDEDRITGEFTLGQDSSFFIQPIPW